MTRRDLVRCWCEMHDWFTVSARLLREVRRGMATWDEVMAARRGGEEGEG